MALSPTAMHETAVELATPPRLSPERCRTLLNKAEDGYLALSRGALPIVLAVSCAVDGESLLVRAGPDLTRPRSSDNPASWRSGRPF